jgi:hypothetical protein
MSTTRKIIIALGVVIVGVFVGVLIIGVVAYRLYSNSTRDGERVFAPTEVGTPAGNKVTKDIGPEGGTLVSPDGRLTLTVPQNALTETVPFSIQPVTSKFETGLGLSYRLEPEGKTFATPVDISVHYDDHDLEGTFPEALSIAYQDKDGAWHTQEGIELNKEKKTVTLAATHFSVYAFIYLYRLSPAKATVHVGESVKILATYCHPKISLLLWLGEKSVCDHGEPWGRGVWKLQGEGKLTIDYSSPAMIYIAPGKKPTPNVATVLFAEKADVIVVEVERPCTREDEIPVGIRGKNDQKIVPPKMPAKCFDKVKMAPELDIVRSVITIADRGYRASGTAGTTVFAGNICDLEKHFTLKTNNPFVPSLEFEPDSISPNKGKFKFATGNGLSGSCECTYTVTGTDSSKTGIELTGVSHGTLGGISKSGGGSMHLDLQPLDKECQQP